jgi:tetratricopeptide (TPR) repeat protein
MAAAQWVWFLLPLTMVGFGRPLTVGEVGLCTITLILSARLGSRGFATVAGLMAFFVLFLLVFSIIGRMEAPLPHILGIWQRPTDFYATGIIILFSLWVILSCIFHSAYTNNLAKYPLPLAMGSLMWLVLLAAAWFLPSLDGRASEKISFWLLCGLWLIGSVIFMPVFQKRRFICFLALGVIGLSCWTGIYFVWGYHQLHLGDRAKESGSYQKAMEHYRHARRSFEWIGMNDLAARSLVGRSVIMLHQNDTENAMQGLAKAHQLQPRASEPVLIRAARLLQSNKPQAAYKELTKLGPLETIKDTSRWDLLNLYLQLEAYAEAARLIQISPILIQRVLLANISTLVLENLADALLVLDQKESALTILQFLLTRPAISENIYSKAGQVYFELGRVAMAAKIFKKLDQSSSGHATAAYFLGVMAEDAGDQTTAVQHYLRALRLNPHHGFALQKTITLLERLKKQSPMLKSLQEQKKALVPQHSVKSIWDNQLMFHGYDLKTTTLKRGASFMLTHYWQVLRSHRKPPLWFVHVDKPYESHNPASKYRLPDTICQQYGTIFEVKHTIVVPDSIDPGYYRLILGAYRPRYDHYYNLKPVFLENAFFHRLPEKGVYLAKIKIK